MRNRNSTRRTHSSPRCSVILGVALLAAGIVVSCKEERTAAPSKTGAAATAPAPHGIQTGSPVTAGTTHIGDIRIEEVSQGWGKTQLNLSITGNRLSIGGQTYSSGLGTHAASRIKIAFDPKFKTFSGSCGVDDWVKDRGSVVFKITSDGNTLFTSPALRGGNKAVDFSVPVEGLSSLVLLAEPGGASIDGDHADWVNLTLK